MRRAAVIGSGPNGLSAGIALARAGWDVTVFEGAARWGGGVRSGELTLPGFVHDICSAVYPMAVVSPFFRTLPLERHGLHWIQPPVPLAHPLDDGTAVLMHPSVTETSAGLGVDRAAYSELMAPLVDACPGLFFDALGPPRFPSHPFTMARVGMTGLLGAQAVAESRFRGAR